MQNLKFLALVVVKIYAVMLSIGFSRRFFPKSGFWGIKGGLLTLGTCPPKGVFTITFLTHVPNFRKIGKNCGRYRGRNVLRTHTHTDKHSSDFISVQCHELHWTDGQTKIGVTPSVAAPGDTNPSDDTNARCTKR